MATGHYARAEQALDRWILRRSVDKAKDQTYFLFSLTQEQLARADFPLGGYTKDEVRAQARTRNIVTADKGESQDICFIGKDGVAGFLKREAPDAFRPGIIRHENGTVLGEHQGLPGYTIGQRKGLGVAWTEPLYVTGINVVTNELTLGLKGTLLVEHQWLRDCTWHMGALPAGGIDVLVRPRYRTKPLAARIVPAEVPGREGKPGAQVIYAEPQSCAAAGQACVAYDLADDYCLGGGWITTTPE